MKKLLLFSILFTLNCSVFGQTNKTTDTISKKNTGISGIGKIGYARIWESGNGPLNGFVQGADLLYSIKLDKDPKVEFWLQTGLSYLTFEGNRTLSGNTAALKNEYLQIPFNSKFYRTIFKNLSKSQSLQYASGFGFYANTLLNQRTEGASVNTSTSNLGWNYGVTFQFGLNYTVADRFNIEGGLQTQHDLAKMEKNGIERKTDNLYAFYFEFKF